MSPKITHLNHQSTAIPSRRQFLQTAAAIGTVGVLSANNLSAADPTGEKTPQNSAKIHNRIAVSTYSFWQFQHEKLRNIEKCLDLAGEMGFDGVEILHRQMENETPGYLQQLKKVAFRNGLDLCGFSTHQGFLSPDPAIRTKNVDHTLHCIELAYALGIPTLRVNTGTWGTSKDFDDLMKNRGIEPPKPGFTDEDGFGWVIDGLTRCLKKAEECASLWG